MKEFTREELTRAWHQMEREREAERQTAERAARWLRSKCREPVQEVQLPSYASRGNRDDAPYLPQYLLRIHYTKYDADFNAWLKARLVSPPEMPGIHRDESGFWLDLGPDEGFPAGTRYYCYTSLTDAGD